MATIKDVFEGPRGCGYRKPGGFYLRTDDFNGFKCGKLPIELLICPCCGQGIKQTRGYNWIKGSLITESPCRKPAVTCELCPFEKMVQPQDDIMLIWIGRKFYKTVDHFVEEAKLMGISRRLNGFPRGFKFGETKIALAHPTAVEKRNKENGEIEFTPGIFYIFTPDRMEYVPKESDTEEYLDKLEERGIDLVKINRKTINPDIQV